MKMWIRSNNVVWEELDGDALLVDSATGGRWLLNATAASIWKFCDGCHTLNQLTRAFAEASGSSLERARREIVECCARLRELNLLQPIASIQSNEAPGALVMCRVSGPASFQALGLTASGPRRRPSPRGNSGPG